MSEVDAKKAERDARKKAEAQRKKEAALKKKAPVQPAQPKAEKTEIRLKKEFVNTTPPGAKKDMSQSMADSYDPPAVEAAWYEWWQKEGFFQPNQNDLETGQRPFVICIPPPNVTGALHIGHALMLSIQDTIIRWRRMRGESVLWLPATDHAGISTQDVVEKKLLKTEGKTRHDYGREEFVKKVWEWKEEYGQKIITQFRRTGSSLDWSREFFSLDEIRNKAVTEAFIRMFEEGLIYREKRLVNWCCKLRSAISNIEVDKIEIEKPIKMKVPGHTGEYDFGFIWQFAYKIEDSEEEIIVATTRPETMLADTAVAIHPEDERYKKYHGKYVVHPFGNRKLPIVLDSELVKLDTGTGAVKITPAHDPNDYLCGKRNNLPFISMFTDDGKVNEQGGQFAGLPRYDARNAVLKELEAKGLYRGRKAHAMVLGLCSRTKDVIEPLMKPQWWVNCKDMAKAAADSVRNGELRIIPENYSKDWFGWLDNIEDWCISRQLWWGHRIPAYLVCIEGQAEPDGLDSSAYVTGFNEQQALEKAAAKFGVDRSKITLKQDEDVLDTWFSSGLFPFSAFGWPEKTVDLERFYPTTLLETGHDILFFWVARMVMMGLKLTGKLPFTEVFLHPMVRDAEGRKMSKHRGNVVDPIWVIEGRTLDQLQAYLSSGNLSAEELKTSAEGQKKSFPNGISECGTDAMRFALCNDTAEGRSINLNINQVVARRNFCNKLWNVIKFALTYFGASFKPPETLELTGNEGFAERYILSRLGYCIDGVSDGIAKYNFASACNTLYSYWLDEFCAIYLEAIKPIVKGTNETAKASACATLYKCIDLGLKLLHPFMPFVTEELWQRLPRNANDATPSIMISKWPSSVPSWHSQQHEENMLTCSDIVRETRKLLLQYGIKRGQGALYIRCDSSATEENLKTFVFDVTTLAGLNTAEVVSADYKADGCAVVILNDKISLLLNLKGQIDVAKELTKLNKQIETLQKGIQQLESTISKPDYQEKAKAELKEKHAAELASKRTELEQVKGNILLFESLK